MFRYCTVVLVFAAASMLCARTAESHCQVPCGVYGDQRRFEELLEDTTTIAKAIDRSTNWPRRATPSRTISLPAG